jgi:hypothetical protein
MDLYSRLFKYAPLPNRTQLENFLTESLCDFLGRMTAVDRKAVECFILDVLLGSHAPLPFRQQIANAKGFCWETQKRIYFRGKQGCIDICMLADKEITLVVENKVTAGFTEHRLSEVSGEEEDSDENSEVPISQLDVYDGWLSENYPRAALVLLTHVTNAPLTFLSKQAVQTDGEPARNVFHWVCRWATIHRWLAEGRYHTATNISSNSQQVFLDMLAGEFREFLEQHNMKKTEIKGPDLDLLVTSLSQDIWNKMRDLMGSVRELVSASLSSHYEQPRYFPETKAWKETEILWDWAYCYEKDLRWYIGWGLSGRHGLRHLDIDFGTELQAFVVVTSDEEGREILSTNEEIQRSQQIGWSVREPTSRNRLRLIKDVPARALLAEPDGFNRAFERWTESAAKEAVSILEKAHDGLGR